MYTSACRNSWSGTCLFIVFAVAAVLKKNQVDALGFQGLFYNCSDTGPPGTVRRLPCDTNKNGKIDKQEKRCQDCDSNGNGKIDPFELFNCTKRALHNVSTELPNNVTIGPESNARMAVAVGGGSVVNFVENDAIANSTSTELPNNVSIEPESNARMAVAIVGDSMVNVVENDAIANSKWNKTEAVYRNEEIQSEMLQLISTSVSIAGSVFIIVSFVMLKEIRTMAYSIIFYLSIVDFFGSVANIVDTLTYDVNPLFTEDPTGACMMESCLVAAAFKMYFQLCSMLWSWVIATNMLLVLVLKVHVKTLKAWQYISHLVVWVLALVGTGTALYLNALGDSGYRCGIVRSPVGTNVEVVLVMIPLCSIFVFNVICFALVIGCFRSEASAQRKAIGYRLSLYALVFLVVRLPSVVSYFVVPRTAADQGDMLSPFQVVVLYAEAVIAPLQGFGDGLVYGLNKQVIKSYKEQCIKCSARAKDGADLPNAIILTQKARFGWSKSRETIRSVTYNMRQSASSFFGDDIDTKQQQQQQQQQEQRDNRVASRDEDEMEGGTGAGTPSTNCEPLLGLNALAEYKRRSRLGSEGSSSILQQMSSDSSVNLSSPNDMMSESQDEATDVLEI